MKKYKIGDRVKTDMTNREGVIIATNDTKDEFRMVKIRFDGWFKVTEWWFESRVKLIII